MAGQYVYQIAITEDRWDNRSTDKDGSYCSRSYTRLTSDSNGVSNGLGKHFFGIFFGNLWA
jgi:hypothetical protein